MIALRTMGYEVAAFEPAPGQLEAGNTVLSASSAPAMIKGTYDDFVRAVDGATTPLTDLIAQPIDAFIFGWASFSHLLHDEERLALLRATKRFAPAAPIILSFSSGEGVAQDDSAARLRRRMRRTMPRLGGRQRVEDGHIFTPFHGFMKQLTAADIESAAQRTGYRVVSMETRGMGRALIAPA